MPGMPLGITTVTASPAVSPDRATFPVMPAGPLAPASWYWLKAKIMAIIPISANDAFLIVEFFISNSIFSFAKIYHLDSFTAIVIHFDIYLTWITIEEYLLEIIHK